MFHLTSVYWNMISTHFCIQYPFVYSTKIWNHNFLAQAKSWKGLYWLLSRLKIFKNNHCGISAEKKNKNPFCELSLHKLDESPIHCRLRCCTGLSGPLIQDMALLWGLKWSHRAPVAFMPYHALQSNKYCSLWSSMTEEPMRVFV